MTAPLRTAAAWTPGPWLIERQSIENGNWDLRDADFGDSVWLGTIHGDHHTPGGRPQGGFPGNREAEANARLIAAAPTMAETIATTIANAEIIPDPRMEGATDCVAIPLDDFEALKAALAKAENRT